MLDKQNTIGNFFWKNAFLISVNYITSNDNLRNNIQFWYYCNIPKVRNSLADKKHDDFLKGA